MPLEREQHALGLQRFLHPFDHLAGLLGPGFVHEHVGIAGLRHVSVVHELRGIFVMVGLKLGVERADGLACRGDVAALLQHDDLCTVLGGRGGCHQAAVASTTPTRSASSVSAMSAGRAGLSRQLPCAATSVPPFVSPLLCGAHPGQRPGGGKRARGGEARQEVAAADSVLSHDSSSNRLCRTAR